MLILMIRKDGVQGPSRMFFGFPGSEQAPACPANSPMKERQVYSGKKKKKQVAIRKGNRYLAA